VVKIGFIFGLLGLLLMANTCAAVGFNISPETKMAHPGDTVGYGLTVNLTGDEDPNYFPITERFSIDPEKSVPGWGYSFSRDSVMLDYSSRTNTSTLYISVPLGTAQGNYSHSVNATAYDEFGKQIGYSTELDVYVVNTNVNNIPEFPSIALPAAAVLGLVAVFGRKKE